jgi:hypothetical protein
MTDFQVMDKNFKWPQVWRSSLGLDHKFDRITLLLLTCHTIRYQWSACSKWGLKKVLVGTDGRLIYTAANKGI